MSRIGRQPIQIPDGVTVNLEGRLARVSGPNGSLTHLLPVEVKASVKDGEIIVTKLKDTRRGQEQFGLQRQLLANMVVGVSTGYEKKLLIQGMGYRVQLNGKTLVFSLGFSHPVEVTAPEGISFKVEGNNVIIISGADKQQVGEIAARIRDLRPPEPYKGKGIRYENEVVRRKAGKAGKAAGV